MFTRDYVRSASADFLCKVESKVIHSSTTGQQPTAQNRAQTFGTALCRGAHLQPMTWQILGMILSK